MMTECNLSLIHSIWVDFQQGNKKVIFNIIKLSDELKQTQIASQ